MITANLASQFVLENFNFAHESETIEIDQALNRILFEDIYSPYDQPPFHRVSMDGIALSAKMLTTHNKFKIESISKAGRPQNQLKDPLACIEVMTGAPLPINTDVVIPYENIKIENGIAILPDKLIAPLLDNVHIQGSDYKKGELVLKKGTRILPPTIALLASCGLNKVSVEKTLKIAIVSTGDELIEPGTQKEDHQIFKSNPFALNSALKSMGFNENKLFHLNDDYTQILAQLKIILDEYQVVAITGGVSMGKFDFIPKALNELNVENIFYKVQQRPGKPLWFGVGPKKQLVFGLPGNPVSCLLNIRKYLCEVLKHTNKNTPSFYVKSDSDFKLNKDMTFFVPAKITFNEDSTISATPLFGNGSGDYYFMKEADGFIEVNNLDRRNQFKKGEIFPFYHWNL